MAFNFLESMPSSTILSSDISKISLAEVMPAASSFSIVAFPTPFVPDRFIETKNGPRGEQYFKRPSILKHPARNL